jgi:G3E family GTPase
VLSIKAGICLVDARHLLQAAYHNNDLFKEQLQIADILVANKIDLADTEAIEAFNFIAKSFSPQKALIATTTNGLLKTTWLDYPHHTRFQRESFSVLPESQSNHWQTHSFNFSKNTVFDLEILKYWISKEHLIRLKGLIQTKDGCYLINYSSGEIDLSRHEDQISNYIEIINDTLDISRLEKAIKLCIL